MEPALRWVKARGRRAVHGEGVRTDLGRPPMLRLAAVIYALTGPTFAGILIIAALVTGFDTLGPILVAAAIGFAGAVPAARMIAQKLSEPRH